MKEEDQGLRGQEDKRLKNLFTPLPLCLFAFILLFPFYLYTMTPTVSVGDSGEFIAAAQTLALPHAPSYPLFNLIAKCAIILNPFGNIAYRVNLVSVIFGIGTAILLFFIARKLNLSILSSLTASLLLFFSNLLWEHSLTTEVFTLNSFFALLIIFSFLTKFNLYVRLSLGAFLFGLGMGNHHTLVLVVPAIALLYLKEEFALEKSIKKVLLLTAYRLPFLFLFFLLGFSIYAYLPIRSLKNPPMDWSNPETLQNFVRVITRADYGSLALTLGEKMPRNLETISGQIGRYLSALIKDVSWFGFVLGCIGWLFWFRREQWQSLAFLKLFIVSGIGFLILGNLPFDAQSSGILPRFYLLPAIPFVLAIGHFFESLPNMLPRHLTQAKQHSERSGVVERVGMRGAAFLGLLLPAFLLFNAHGHRTFSRTDFTAYDYGRNILRTLPPNSILFMDGGDDTFYTLAYLTMAEKKRTDLALHDRGGLIFKNPYGDDFRKITKEQKEARRQQIEISYLGMRPLYYSTFNREILKGAKLFPRGILYQAEEYWDGGNKIGFIFQEKRWHNYNALWYIYSYRGVYETNPHQPYRLRALLPLYPYLQGLQEFGNSSLLRGVSEARGVGGEGLKFFRRAAGFGTDILWLQSNLAWETSFKAYELTNQNRISEAEKLYAFVIQVDRKFVSAYSNLGVLAERKNENEKAETYYKKAIEIDSKYAEAYYNLGVLYWKQSRWQDVIAMFEKTLQLNPNHPSASKYLFLARQKVLGRR